MSVEGFLLSPFTPAERLGLVILVLIVAIKLAALHGRSQALEFRGLIAYSLWPGVDTKPFTERTISANPQETTAWLRQGLIVTTLGASGATALIFFAPSLNPTLVGWLGVALILTILHLGLSDVFSATMRKQGFQVRRLFRNPLASISLREFWSRRWNLAFVEMNQVLFIPRLSRWLSYRAAVAAAFLISGLLHELAISVPVHDGYGGPLAYFILHGALITLEGRIGLDRWPPLAARLWTWIWILVPLPLLFHTAFRDELVVPLFTWR